MKPSSRENTKKKHEKLGNIMKKRKRKLIIKKLKRVKNEKNVKNGKKIVKN